MSAINSEYKPIRQNSKDLIGLGGAAIDQKSSKIATAILIASVSVIAGAAAGAIVGTIVPGIGTGIGTGAGIFLGLIVAVVFIARMCFQHYQLNRLKEEVANFIKDKDAITLPKALRISAKIDAFQTKYQNSPGFELAEVRALQNSLLDSVKNQATGTFNVLRNKIVTFISDDENSTKFQEGTSLIKELTEFQENFGNRSPNGKLTGLVFANARVDYVIEHKDIENLKSKMLFFINDHVPSFDLITTAIAINNEPLTVDETWFCRQFAKKFPNLSAAKSMFRSLQARDLDEQKKEKITFNTAEIDCIRLNPKDQFLVHTTASVEMLNRMLDEEISGTVCTSLIAGNTSYFHPEKLIGIILSVDPACIATTAKEDIQSPMVNPGKKPEHQEVAKQYYNFHRKFQMIATYIDLIFKNCYGPDATDAFTLYHMLLAQEEAIKLDKGRNEDIEALRLELAAQINELKQKHQNDPIFQSKNQWKEEGVTSFQLRTLIKHFEDNPNEDTPDRFRTLFGREGEGVRAELEKCHQFVQEILAPKDDLSRMNISRFLNPHEILAQTHRTQDNGYFDYNEIGLDLRPEMGYSKGMLKVKGILIDKQLIRNKFLTASEKAQLSQIIETARQRNLPIFYR